MNMFYSYRSKRKYDWLPIKSISSFSRHMLINDSDTSHIDLANLFSYFLSKAIDIENIDLRFDFFKKKIVFISKVDQLNFLNSLTSNSDALILESLLNPFL